MRLLAPLLATLLACAGANHREPPATASARENASERLMLLSARLSEAMNCLAAAALDWPLFESRGEDDRRRAARAAVAAVRELCGDPRGTPFTFCGKIQPSVSALHAALSGGAEGIRAAARDVLQTMGGEVGMTRPGVSLDRFLQVSAGLWFLEQIASGEGWRALSEEPEPALRASVLATVIAVEETCSDSTAPPHWDCPRARPHLDTLRRLAGEPPLDERVRAPARALLKAVALGGAN